MRGRGTEGRGPLYDKSFGREGVVVKMWLWQMYIKYTESVSYMLKQIAMSMISTYRFTRFLESDKFVVLALNAPFVTQSLLSPTYMAPHAHSVH